VERRTPAPSESSRLCTKPRVRPSVFFQNLTEPGLRHLNPPQRRPRGCFSWLEGSFDPALPMASTRSAEPSPAQQLDSRRMTPDALREVQKLYSSSALRCQPARRLSKLSEYITFRGSSPVFLAIVVCQSHHIAEATSSPTTAGIFLIFLDVI